MGVLVFIVLILTGVLLLPTAIALGDPMFVFALTHTTIFIFDCEYTNKSSSLLYK